MLHFIFGRASSGKTTAITEELCRQVDEGKEGIILLVPEQYSFENERMLLRRLAGSSSDKVEVLSFTRLYDRVGRELGGIAGNRIDDGGRMIVMGQALKAVAGELSLYRGQAGSTEFAAAMLSAVAEFKQCAVTPEMLLRAAGQLPEGSLREKSRDIALVISAYDALLSQNYVDPLDDLTRLYRQLSDYAFFAERTVFIDSFKGFTAQQFLLLDRIVAQAEEVYLTLCTDRMEAEDDGLGLFSNIKKTARSIAWLAQKHGVALAEPVYLTNCHIQEPALRALERGLFDLAAAPFPEDTEAVTVCAAGTAYEESAFIARTIRSLVRQRNYRYRDFAVIARDVSLYDGIIDTALAKHGIPCFIDSRKPADSLPLMVFASAALKSAVTFKTDTLLCYLKTLLTPLSGPEIALLENYVYLWNIDRREWLSEWSRSPDGFRDRTGLDKAEREEEKARLEEINRLRRLAIGPVARLAACPDGTAESLASAFFRLLTDCGAADRLRAYADFLDSRGEAEYADLQRQSWDFLMNLLDQLVLSLKEERISLARFGELFEQVLAVSTLGSIPQKLDEVQVGSADRMRPGHPKVTFLLGANQGVFPGQTGNGGLFNPTERARLIELGLSVADNWLGDAVEENFLLYTSVCSPSERLYVTYCCADRKGKKQEPSSLIGRIYRAVPGCRRVTESASDPPVLEKIEAPVPALEQTAAAWRTGGEVVEALKSYFEGNALYRDRLHAIRAAAESAGFILDKTAAGRLYGETIRLSATRLDVFHRCKFSYFCRFGLQAKQLRPADLDVLQRGTIVHFVLEKIISRYGKELADTTASQRNQAVREYMDAYVAQFMDGAELKEPRFLYLFRRISLLLEELVSHIAAEFSQSEFSPVACELPVDYGGQVKPLEIPLQSGGKVAVCGTIDRVDLWSDRGKNYVRIVDYKTGSRSFNLPDVLYGLNLQMLIYLYTLKENGAGVLGGEATPTGILYMPSKRPMGQGPEPDELSVRQSLQMNGLLLDNIDVLQAMEKGTDSVYIPVKYGKKDRLPAKNENLIGEADFETIGIYIKHLLAQMGESLRAGEIEADPLDGRDSSACQYCDFHSVCGREPSSLNRKVPKMSGTETLQKMKEREKHGI